MKHRRQRLENGVDRATEEPIQERSNPQLFHSFQLSWKLNSPTKRAKDRINRFNQNRVHRLRKARTQAYHAHCGTVEYSIRGLGDQKVSEHETKHYTDRRTLFPAHGDGIHKPHQRSLES